MKRLAFLVLAACAPLQMAVDPAFTPDERTAILQAAEEWNRRTLPGHRITFDGDVWRIQRVDVAGEFTGWTSRSAHVIQIEPGRPTKAIAMHEFGHALGLRHVCAWSAAHGAETGPPCVPGQSAGVMDPITGSTEFSDADIAECRHAGVCK